MSRKDCFNKDASQAARKTARETLAKVWTEYLAAHAGLSREAEQAKAAGSKPFFTDTNTLYKGSRSNSVDHLGTAAAHGFVPEVCGAPVIIADGLKSSDWREVPMPATCTQFKSTKIAKVYGSRTDDIAVSISALKEDLKEIIPEWSIYK